MFLVLLDNALQTMFLKCSIISGAGSISNPDDFAQFIQRNLISGEHVCQICNYSQKQLWTVKNHVESKHFPNSFTYNCPMCEKVFGTNQAFMKHKNRAHKPS